MPEIIMKTIGIINSPYKEPTKIRIQGRFKEKIEAWVEIKDNYVGGLKDLDKFSHAILICY